MSIRILRSRREHVFDVKLLAIGAAALRMMGKHIYPSPGTSDISLDNCPFVITMRHVCGTCSTGAAETRIRRVAMETDNANAKGRGRRGGDRARLCVAVSGGGTCV
jgi:hypothetical protein